MTALESKKTRIAAAEAEYEKVRDTAEAEYKKVRGPALAEYNRKRRAIEAEP